MGLKTSASSGSDGYLNINWIATPAAFLSQWAWSISISIGFDKASSSQLSEDNEDKYLILEEGLLKSNSIYLLLLKKSIIPSRARK